jgi:drug/metabolite transporter (DMT)-like permease
MVCCVVGEDVSVAVLLALCSALSYGGGDFLGGLGGRRASPAQISIIVQCVGVIVAALAVAATSRGVPPAAVLAWGALSGLGSGIGNVALYRGLAAGAMNVVAPVSAVVTAVLPATVGLGTGDQLSASGWAGLLLALPALALVSTTQASDPRRADLAVRHGLWWGFAAGCGFGLLFIALDSAGTASGAWPLLPGQLVALAVVLILSVPAYRRLRRSRTDRQPPSWRSALAYGVPSGLGGAGGNLLFFTATGFGQLTVVAVLTALYPAVTVGLAAVLLGERANKIQGAGFALCAVAIMLITVG